MFAKSWCHTTRAVAQAELDAQILLGHVGFDAVSPIATTIHVCANRGLLGYSM